MKTIIAGNPPLEEVVQHFGVKGMRWGVRRTTYKSGEIKDARRRSQSLARGVQNAEDKVNLAKTPAAKASAQKEWDKASKDWLRSPDRATAMRMTAGEKAAAAMLVAVTAGGAAPFVAGYGGLRVGVRKANEKVIRDLNTKDKK